jgi:putative ATP-dependent endonuclease of OLD family
VDSDYLDRRVENEFLIEAVMSIPGGEINRQGGMAWPWEWDGQDAVIPGAEAAAEPPAAPRPPVYKVRVRGTADLELVYEIVQPDDTCAAFSGTLRREIGLVRLSGDDRNDRDLRLVQGSSLDRLLNDRGLRARLGREIAADAVDRHLDADSRARLTELDQLFTARLLPDHLGLAFTGGTGLSINSLVGLTADKHGVLLPLATWGAGTRRLAALAIADALQDGHPIALVDEVERGLEPYRQRQLVKAIAEARGQSFITTHSASVIGAAATASLWYVDARSSVGELPRAKIARHQAKDPEAFLARLTIVAEGATEVGFLYEILDREFPAWRDRGVHVTDAGGNDNVLDLVDALASGGLKFGGFADNEGTHAGRWQALQERLGALLFRWADGNTEQNVIPLVPPERLTDFIADPGDEKTGMRLRSLAERLQVGDTSLEAITAAADAAGRPLTSIIVEAATGKVPEHLREAPAAERNPYKGHASLWFKSVAGGRELARKMHDLGVWNTHLQASIGPFLQAVIAAQQDPVRVAPAAA